MRDASCADRPMRKADAAIAAITKKTDRRFMMATSTTLESCSERPTPRLPQAECDDIRPGGDGDILIAVHRVRHRTGSPILVGVEQPQPLPVGGIDGDEPFVG